MLKAHYNFGYLVKKSWIFHNHSGIIWMDISSFPLEKYLIIQKYILLIKLKIRNEKKIYIKKKLRRWSRKKGNI